MRIRAYGLMSLALAVCLATAVDAQDEGRQRGNRQRGGPGGGFGRGPGGPGGFGPNMRSGGAIELMGLLRDEKVRKAVDLADATYEAANKAVEEASNEMREEGRSQFQGFRDASEDERAELRKKMEGMMEEVNQVAQETLDEILPPDEQQRLMGLLIQLRGMSAVTNEVIAKQIGLDEQGIEKVEEAARESQSGMREKMQELFQSARGGGGGGGDMREKMREMMEEGRAEADKAISGALTAKQREEVEKLKGDKFEFSENMQRGGFGPGRGGAGGGRRGGPGGGGPRGGDRN